MKTKRFLLLFLALCLILACAPQASAASDGEFLVSKGGKTITSVTTLDEVRQMFGQEKLVTESIFGGSAYTFYGENYADYLYIETDAEGKICSYSTFGNDFTSNAGNSGEKDNPYIYFLGGEAFVDRNNCIWAVVGYSKQNIRNSDEIIDRYQSNPKYAIAIIQHAIPMWSAIAQYCGRPSTIAFDEKTFYVNRQLMEGGSDVYGYCRITGQAAFTGIHIGYLNNMLKKYVSFFPNPCMYAQYGRDYYNRFPENSNVVFDYSYEKDHLIVGSLQESFFSVSEPIAYTEHEQELLENAAKLYAESVATYNSAETYYITEPQDEALPLEAGQIHPQILEGALGYLNAIRAAADLPLLELSAGLSEDAQHKAVLTMYLSKNNISNPSPHDPEQPEGVPDEFYGHAQSTDVTGSYGENLFYGNVLTSITHALDDGYGDYITCFHRQALINPHFSHVGFGEASGQGVHKFSGYQAFDGDIVAWPSKGVMLLESLSRSNPTFTVNFYNNYTPTSDSGIIFRCLNTGDTVTFPAGMENTNDQFLYVNNSIVSYYSNQISLHQGYVYEITVTNVIHDATGQLTDYTYRSVCESAAANSETQPAQLDLDTESLTIGVTSTSKISARILPEEAPNRMVRWSSSNEAVATVNENGYVTGHAPGTATITASTDNGIRKTCTVEVTDIVTTPMYRLYNPNSGEHFYTGSVEERENLVSVGWNYEGVAWNAPTNSGDPVYRLFNPNNGDHHYTMSMEEVENLKAAGWQYEGVAWNSASSENVPQFRLYNPNADCGSHHYTSSTEERDYLVSLGWRYEGIGWYGMLK